ncbi:hydrocephalus-inducing protein homolog [Heptranchias perlo]|uniref:hydrocephalus-inducing protein homolog n=1 Tax=Heptranchias perlo TaxID=212740 RepID=UPI003559611D
MAAGNVEATDRAMQSTFLKMPEGFKSKVVEPCNPKMIKGEVTHVKLTPSAFMKEMSLDTKQKLANTHEMYLPPIVELLDMTETTLQKYSILDIDQPMFQPFPSEIIFQNYKPCEIYEVPLILRNHDQVPRMVKVVQEDSPYFKIVCPNDVGRKVAPGMVTTFKILFVPEENKDYVHELICVTEREKFLVPVKAIGARAILDFPDYINFSVCPVKYNTQKTLLVRNIGKREAMFILQTKKPFFVEPLRGNLEVGQSIQVTVEFIPQRIGDHSEDLMLHLDTGEDIFVNLYGAATDINVRLDKNSVMIEKTYISMANLRVVSICNRSDVIVHFQWKAFATPEEEDQQKIRFFSDLLNEEEEETDRFLEECAGDPTLRERISILSHTFQNRRQVMQDDRMLLSDNIIITEPVEGDIWPNSTAEISVICRPQEAKVYQRTVYCDVTGRETRLPLRIKAEGLGPKLLLNFDQIEMGNIVVSSKHTYEMLLANKGDIPAVYSLIPALTPVGSCFSFNPREGTLLPGGYQVLEVTFKSTILGEFIEDLHFSADGSPQPIQVTFKGRVIGPTFHFNLPVLNFGEVSFGFPCTISCRLINTSPVPMTFELRVPGDGSAEISRTSFSQASEHRRIASWANIGSGVKPKEFAINPSHGTIKSHGEMEIQVTLCSNTPKKYELALVVDVENVGEEVLAIPILARCIVPNVEVVNPHIDLGRCFLKYPYQCMVNLRNTNDLPACYGVVPQDLDDQLGMLYSSPKSYGVIDPCCTVEVPLFVEAQCLGEHDIEASIAIFGKSQFPLGVCLSCIGEGPVVHATSTKIDWGKIQVLHDVPRTICLSNESLIPARVTAKMVLENSKWRLEPSEAVIPPRGHMNLTIVAHLDDTVWSEDKLHLAVENSHTKSIHVQATGIGTTIVPNKPFGPVLNLGAVFSSNACRYSVKLTNRGRRNHQMYWVTEGFPLIFKPSPQKHPVSRDMKYRNSPPLMGHYYPIFRVRPLRMDLAPGRSSVLVLEGESDIPRVVHGQLICHAIIGGQSGKERIITVNVNCEFIAPILELSTKQLNFRVEKPQHEVLVPQYKPLALKNISPLPLTLILSMKEPFTIVEKQENEATITSKTVKLDVGENLELLIRFEPSFKDDLYIRVAEEILTIQYLEHPHVDYVVLRGEVNFPNLHFETAVVDFGCILNDTEMVRHVSMTNCSPLLVKYRWSFLLEEPVDWSFLPVCKSGTEIVHLEAKEGEGEAKLTDKPSLQEVALVIEDSDRKLAISTGNLNEEEKTDAENETREGQGSPKENSHVGWTKGPEANVLSFDEVLPNPSEADKLLLNQTEDWKCLHWSCNQEENKAMLGVEQVFDILPLFGVLRPNEIQQVAFTFYGHMNIISEVKAICEVEGGPTYEVTLKGEASFIKYAFDRKEIDYGHQLFNHVAVTEITLMNTGKVGFDFTILNHEQAADQEPLPGVPLIAPFTGYIEANAEQKLRVSYLPGVPETFHKSFEIQVSHFEPDSISLKGEGNFLRIYLDLPRNIKGNLKYEAFLKEAKKILEREASEANLLSRPEIIAGELGAAESLSSYDALLQMEVERLLIKDCSLAQELILSSRSVGSSASQRIRRGFSRCHLPEYILDFGFVILSTVKVHIVKITNTGALPVSFHTDRQALKNTGFSTELQRVKNLPYCETETFEVRFDPLRANLNIGCAEALMSIEVVGGPTVNVILNATVTMPGLAVSNDQLDFGIVQCGQCQVITIQLYNHLDVACEWMFTDTSIVKEKLDKHVPLHLRSKLLKELKPPSQVFIMLPPCGVLGAGERVNVQVTFIPAEDKLYNHHLALNFAQSSNRVMLMARGKGLEPRLDFSTTLLELGPTLPYSTEVEGVVIVKNPCNFPVEFYSVEFDEKYLEEEKILRMMKGYSSVNTLMLPPRLPGEKLPYELLDYYKEQTLILEEQEQAKRKGSEATGGESDVKESEVDEKLSDQTDKQERLVAPMMSRLISESEFSSRPTASPMMEDKKEAENEATEKVTEVKEEKTKTVINVGVGELEITPISLAIGRYLGLDLSPEGCAARNRRGVAFIVCGTPLSGKTNTAIFLAKYYGAAYLTIDAVVREAVSSGTTAAAMQARELCVKAAMEQMLREADDASQVDGIMQQSLHGIGGAILDGTSKHTPEGSPTSEVKASNLSSNTLRKSTILTGKTSHAVQKQQFDMLPSQISTIAPVMQQPMSVTTSLAGETSLMGCQLTDEVLVEILTERLQLNDCFQGVVFDGLENLYSYNEAHALTAVLKAINNRRHIYVVNLSQEFAALKAKEKAKQEEEEQLAKDQAEKERIYLEELGEEEYEALPEEERAAFDRKRAGVFRERREKVLKVIHERHLQEQKWREEMERLREEEELKKKSKKGKKDLSIKEDAKKMQMSGKVSMNVSTMKPEAPEVKGVVAERPDSFHAERGETEEGPKKKKSYSVKNNHAVVEGTATPQEDMSHKQPEKLLFQRFQKYDRSQKKISRILEFWDRAQGMTVIPTFEDSQSGGEEHSAERPAPSGKKGKKDRLEKLEKERAEKERAEKDRLEREKAEKERLEKLREEKSVTSPQSDIIVDGDGTESTEKEEVLGVPQIKLHVTDAEDCIGKHVLDSGKAPSVEEVLDSLGLGPKGPPIPPPALFAVVQYPVERRSTSEPETLSHFSISPNPEEGKLLYEEKKEAEPEPEPVLLIVKEELQVQHKGKSKKDKADKADKAETDREKRRSGGHKKIRRDSRSSGILGAWSPQSEADRNSVTEDTTREDFKVIKILPYRWIVQPGEEVILRVHFSSVVCGRFDQTLNFELLGTQRCYKVYCRGICSFPTISQDPRVVFRHRKKNVKPGEIPIKKYIVSSGEFQFGPLLCGITRDRYKEGHYPENMEIIRIMNTSSMEAEVFFCYQRDVKAATYLVDPPNVTLKAHQKKDVTIWAYPTAPGKFDDCLVCCIRENPEPVLFKVCCYGVRPELELDRKQLHFDKMILHRKDSKSLVMRNNCLLAVAWRISGLENLGDDFSVSQDQGIIDPKTEFRVHMHFRAMRQVNLRKYIRLEVYDAENILGIVQTENILVLAEAYDVALDISFPKGTDGGIDFGVIKVFDNVKQTITLKNKGKYEIGYRFDLQPTKRDMPDLRSLFNIQPIRGSLSPNDRASHIYINFHAIMTTDIKDEPILRCQVIEPNLGEGGETIASIPVKISVRAIFTSYQILPAREINFGTMLVGNRKSRTFILENNCEFDFKYSIFKMPSTAPHRSKKGGGGGGGGEKIGSSSLKSNGGMKQKEQAPQARVTVGMFSVTPGYGAVLPGGQQVITVECSADQIGKHEELLNFNITDRDPIDHPSGIPYWLVAECCAPSIVVDDIASIFEEHRICQNINLHQCLQTVGSNGVYVEDEKRFLFHNIHVGEQAEARYKIINVGKVSSDVVVSVKPLSNKIAARIVDIFDVVPTRMNIPSYAHKFVVVRFTPQTMQNYQCIFEALVEGSPGVPKAKSLLFDIVGDGNLPRINVLRPLLRNKIGNPLLIYSRLLLHQAEKLPVVLKNDGTLPAQVSVNLSDDHGVFSLKLCSGTICVYPKHRYIKEEDPKEVKESCMLTIKLNSGEEAKFVVTFQPTLAQRLEGALYLSVFNNQYEDTIVQLVGEGYQDDITLDNIHGLVRTGAVEKVTRFLEESDIQATRLDHIHFGDCHIGKPYQVTFTMTNRSVADVVRFEWLSDISELKISPQFGHLHAGCAKDMTMTFKSDQPVTYSHHAVKCMVSKITFPVPADQVLDWDNRLTIVKWIDAGKGVRPAKKKVVEIDPEPAHSVLEDSARELELKISAMVDYSDFECTCESIIFKDTLLYQSRVYSLEVTNKGPGALDYLWQVVMDGRGRSANTVEVSSESDGQAASEESNGTASTSALAGRSTSRGTQTISRYGSAVESSASQVSNVTENPPFVVEPCSGVIAAMETLEFQVKFVPLEVGEFEARLICSIPNLKEGAQGQVVAVKGRSLLPYCHFDLEDSNYISSNRRNPELSGPRGAPPGVTLDPNTRVIEFQAVGVNTVNKRSFYIVNPTNADYSFQWISESLRSTRVQPAFYCLTEKGHIAAGMKAEVSFEFVPQQLDITESFWSFRVPELSITVPFLLCGNTTEPAVSLDRSHINFKFVLLGHNAHETAYIINNEASPVSFHFREDTLRSEGYASKFIVEPMEGIALPHSSMPIAFSFTPTVEGKVNFNVVCDVKTKTQPLTLNVKIHGYYMIVAVTCEASDGTVTELSPQSVNEICFREVELNDHISYRFVISNNGRFNFDFEWELSGPPHTLSCLSLSCEQTSIEAGSSVLASIKFHPDHKMVLKDVQLKLKIQKGPVFVCVLTGYTVTPSIHLSFTSYDFGPCFIYKAGMTPCKKTLLITNNEEQGISLDCLFPKNSYLDVSFQPCTLPSKKTVEATIVFYPREPIKYQEVVTFEINGLIRQSAKIFGQGTEMKIEVVNPNNKVVYFQALRVGQTVMKVVPIVNRSSAPLTFILAATPNQQLLQNLEVLSLSPNGKITLKARGGTCDVVVTFSPNCRIPQFAEEVMMECAGVSKALFVIRGCCQGIEITLDQDCIPFGAVVLRSQAIRLVMMQNVGDIGASFRWDIEKFKPHFSITPVEGYISSGMEVSLEVAFHPTEINADIRFENLSCFIEGAKPLHIYLTGSCVAASAMKEMVNFSCQVRAKQTHSIVLTNRTNQLWNLRPLIEGEYWTGPKTITVQPHQQNQSYEITYRPLTMTFDGKKHQGSVFFPLPDGTGLLYMLQGVAEPPKAIAVLNREVPCKTSYTVMLSISNWLYKPQRFRATLDLIKPERLETTTTLKGLDYIDVPGSSRRDYRLNFFTYKESFISVKVTFRNEATLEYLYYILNIKATPPGLIGTIEMVAPVRQSTSGTVEVENPLTVPTVFSTDCKIADISLPTQLIVPPQAKGVLNFEYQPVKVGETSGRLTLNNNELGVFQYDLILKAKPAGLEKPLYFRTTFGGNQVLSAKFMNHSRQKLEYQCKVDSSDFLVDKSITVSPASPGGSEVSVEVTYEPLRVGESRATLNIFSSIGGEYNIPLFGMCLPAKPQGPFQIRAGSTTSIPFKNIFPQVTTFSFQVDNPVFVVKPTETLRSKKTHVVVVSFEATTNTTKSPVTGKLVASCPRSAGTGTVISWIYYLKGFTPDK